MKEYYSVYAQGYHSDVKILMNGDVKILMNCDVKDISQDKVVDVVKYFIEKGMSVINIEYEYGVDE